MQIKKNGKTANSISENKHTDCITCCSRNRLAHRCSSCWQMCKLFCSSLTDGAMSSIIISITLGYCVLRFFRVSANTADSVVLKAVRIQSAVVQNASLKCDF